MREKKSVWILDLSFGYQLAAGLVFWLTLMLVGVCCNTILQLRVRNRRNLHKVPGSGCFLISNHTLYLDPGIMAYVFAPRRILFSAMEETFYIPYLGGYIRLLGAFPIPDEMSLRRLVKPVKQALDRGWLVHFFPERHLKWRNQSVQPFFPGVFFLAQLFNVPVVPVALVLKHPKLFGRPISRYFVWVKVVVGKPLYPNRFRTKGRDRREALATMASHARAVIQEAIDRERGRVN
jgi:1-acyl-sn-glycerol-3-phosphate acyltransferase